MKLTVKLTASRRSEIEGCASRVEALIEKYKGLLEQSTAALRLQKNHADEITGLESRASAGDREASRELLAAQDQEKRNGETIERLDAEMDGGLRKEMNGASVQAHAHIKELLSEAREELMEKLFTMVSPYFYRSREARARINQFEAIQGINAFITGDTIVDYSKLPDALAQLLERRKKLTVILSREAIIREWEGCDITGG